MRVDIKVTPLLFCCSIFSTVVSFMGGLVLYLESIQAVEETVEEIAMSESKAASLILKQAIEEAKRAGDRQSSLMNVWQPFETSTEILEWHLSDAFSLINSSQLYGTGIIVIFNYTQRNPDDHSNISGIYSSVWWDPLTHADWIKSNGGERSYTTSSTYGSQKGIPCVEGEVTPDYCTVGMRLDASTGKIAEPAYNYTGTAVFETWLPGGDALQLLPPGWQHQRVSRWRGVQSWISPDRTMYDYVEYVAVAPLLKSASSLLNDAFIVSRSWIYFGAWTDLLVSMHFESSLFVVAGDLLLAANDRKAMERKCGWNNAGQNTYYADEVHPCSVVVSDQVPAVATAIRTLSTTRDAQFLRQSLSGEDYWILRRTVFAAGIHDELPEVFLVWMRSVSSVEDKMIRSLLFFVCFIGVVIVFDTFVVTLETMKIGRPLSALTKAVKHIDKMDLSSAVEELDRYNINKAYFSVKDIRMLYVSFHQTINSLKEYKASMPLNALPGGAAGGLGSKGVTMEEPQFLRLHTLFITLLNQTNLGPLNELLTQLKFPEGIDKMELLVERANSLEAARGSTKALRSLGLVERLVLYIYTMEGTDIDRYLGFDDAPEWMELEQFGTEEERREALMLWKLGADEAAAAASVEGVRILVEKFRGGLLPKIEDAQACYRAYKDRIGGSRNADLYKVLCASLRTIQNAEGSVTDFVGSLQKLISQGFINFIAVLCCS
eukprot:Hpha_TRINITY_DN16937_c0_g1::TRINITY_DN16937_c0_g1_i6::g.53029::m.53029